MTSAQTVYVAIASVFAMLSVLPAQSTWQMQGGRMRAAVVAGEDNILILEPGKQIVVSDGVAKVHFATNANGKPSSLKLAAAVDSYVDVAIDPAEPVHARKLPAFVAEDFEGTLIAKGRAAPIHVQAQALTDAALHDYRISATVESVVGASMFGIVARHHESSGCYLFSVDWRARVLRLERWVGADHVIVGQVDAPWLLPRHTLALQVDGFRLQCFVDEEAVLQSFDGALGDGSPGVAWAGNRPTIGSLMLEPVARPLASAALVQGEQRANLYASVPFAPGHLYMLELALDRPHAWLPRTLAGFEVSLMQPFAAPVILWADWRRSFGRNTVGEVGRNGCLSCELALPDLLTLRLKSALARVLIITPSGGAVVGATPSVRVGF